MYKITVEVDCQSLVDVLNRANNETPVGFRNALKETAEDIARDTRDNIKRNSYKNGDLYRSVNTEYGKQGTQATIKATAKHASFIEYGTRAHTIYPKSKGALRFDVGGQVIFAKKINHPGIAEKPFLKPAFDENIPEFIKRLEKVIDEFN